MNLHEFTVEDIEGKQVALSKYRGKVVLLFNSATKCGFTPQYEELQKLYELFKNEPFEILDFPSNQFLKQAPEDNKGIHDFCTINFGVTFPQFAKADVNGENQQELFKWLKEEKPEEVKNTETEKFYSQLKAISQDRKGSDIRWNFTKFLIDKNGNVVERYAPNIKPLEIENDIRKLLEA